MAVTAEPPRPSKVEVSREADASHWVRITHGSTTSANPVEWTRIYRQAVAPASGGTGVPTDPGFVLVEAWPGKLTKWRDLGTRANRKYTYRVYTRNSKGTSPFRTSNTVFTTPATPQPLARRTGSSTAVVDYPLPSGTLATKFDVRDNGVTVATNVGPSFTHAASSNLVDHLYSIRSRVSFTDPERGALTLYGPWRSAATLIASAPPAAPSLMAPGSESFVPPGTVRFEWVHNGLDGTVQSAYELQYRVGAGAWTTLTGTTAAFRDVTLAVNEFEWQVRTKGGHASFGPWSASSFVTVADVPVVAVTTPGGTYASAYLTVGWSYTQAQSYAQSEWLARLIFDGETVEEVDGEGATLTADFSTVLETGESYTLEVLAAASGLWSAVASHTFTTDIAPPDTPTITGVWNEATGLVTVVAEAGPGSPATVSLKVERAIDGVSWEHVASVDGVELTVLDGESLSFGVTAYMVTAYTALGGKAYASVNVVAESGAVWLSGGEQFLTVARLPFSPVLEITSGRERAAQEYDGRSLPVAYAGKSRKRIISVSGMTDDSLPGEVSALVDDLDELAQAMSPLHMHRDPDGRRVKGVLSDIGQPRVGAPNRWQFAYTVTEATA